ENLPPSIRQCFRAYGPARMQHIPATISFALADEFRLRVDFPSHGCKELQGFFFLGRQGGEILDLLQEPIGVLPVVFHASTSLSQDPAHLLLTPAALVTDTRYAMGCYSMSSYEPLSSFFLKGTL